MAVRLSGSQNLNRTAALPAQTAFTCFAFGQFASLTGDIFALESSGGAAGVNFYISAGADFRIWNGTGQASGFTPALNTPYALAFVGSASATTIYWRALTAPTLSTYTTGQASGFTAAQLTYGDEVGGFKLNGRMWGARCWGRVLTPAEILAESFSLTPVSRQSLNFAWMLRNAQDLTDISGNGRPPTVVGTLTTEIGDVERRLIRFPTRRLFGASTAGVSGTFSSTLGGVSMAATGAVDNRGTFASTLAGVSMAASGTVAQHATGTFASTLAGVTQAASGVVDDRGTFASTLDGVTMAASGSVGSAPSGSFASTLAGLTMAASGQIIVPGVFASSLAGASMAAAGLVDNRGSFASTLAGASMSAAGTVAPNVTGTFGSTLDGVSMAAGGFVGTPPAAPTIIVRRPRNPRHHIGAP